MRWTRINPGAGDIEGIQGLAKARQDRADVLSTTTLVNLQSAINEASSPDWTADAATAFVSTAQALLPEVGVIIAELANDAQALYAYAAAVAEIQSRLVAVRCQQDNATADQCRLNWMLDDLRGDTTLAPDPVTERHRSQLSTHLAENDVMLQQVEAGLDDLGAQRTAADRACVAALTSAGSRGNLAKLNGVNFDTLSTADVLRTFAGLSAAEIAVLLKEHPTPTEQFWTSPPDPRMVKAWWAGLGAGAQAALIAALPIVIGNLEGVPYATRKAANKLNITVGIAALKKKINWLRDSIGDHEHRPEIEKQMALLETQAADYKKLRDEKMTFFDAGQGQNVTVTGHNLLLFDPKHDAIAEYSGVLDPVTGNIPASVKNVGVYVPGTNSTIGNFDAEVSRSEQLVVTVRPRGSLGMITWKGGAFPQWGEAVSGGLTEKLGERLAHFGEGIQGANSSIVTSVGYSAGGSIMGSAEHAGLEVDRSLQVSGAGMGHGVWSLKDYPNTSALPHYSMLAPGDNIVGLSQGFEADDWGHGGSPLTTAGFTRIETGYEVAGDQSSGQIEGHFDVWDKNGTAMKQMLNVISGGKVELYAVPQPISTDPMGPGGASNPIMEDGYKPHMVKVTGGNE